jgi:hypothetical protein
LPKRKRRNSTRAQYPGRVHPGSFQQLVFAKALSELLKPVVNDSCVPSDTRAKASAQRLAEHLELYAMRGQQLSNLAT